MKPKATNSTVNYEPQVINEETQIQFTKVINASNVTLYGKITKKGDEVGTVSYDKAGNYFITNLKPMNLLTPAEIAGIYAVVPTCLQEAIAE